MTDALDGDDHHLEQFYSFFEILMHTARYSGKMNVRKVEIAS